jgi:hypothetical protein
MEVTLYPPVHLQTAFTFLLALLNTQLTKNIFYMQHATEETQRP